MKNIRQHPWYRRALKALLIALALPYALTLLYRFVPPVSTLMLADIVTLQPVHRSWVPLSQISPNLVNAVIASEDGAFCSHHGMDFKQMQRSISVAIDRDRPVAATSTITQQTVKNLYLWGGRSYARKLLEAPLTFWTELWWPKRRIVEAYLNIAEWGEGIYGAEAASRRHFGISAKNLDARQAALLAATLPNPIERNAGRPGPGTQEIASAIQRRVRGTGPEVACVRQR